MKRVKVKINNASIDAEVVDTFFKKAIGLMFRKILGEGKGMLFFFDREDRHIMWMFGMRFPIDIIWIDKKMRVVSIAENARPRILFYRTYIPKKKAKYVLEVNSGFIRRHGIKLGSKVYVKSIKSSYK